MLPRPLYENLPYLCIFFAALIFASQTGPLLNGSALLLFLAGSWAWVLRSKHRRPDRVRVLLEPDSLIPHFRRLVLPVYFYECLPFAYMAAGWCVLVSMDTVVGQLSGGLLVMAGGIVWRMRFVHRMKPSVAMAFI